MCPIPSTSAAHPNTGPSNVDTPIRVKIELENNLDVDIPEVGERPRPQRKRKLNTHPQSVVAVNNGLGGDSKRLEQDLTVVKQVTNWSTRCRCSLSSLIVILTFDLLRTLQLKKRRSRH